jgi:hypothetical protein
VSLLLSQLPLRESALLAELEEEEVGDTEVCALKQFTMLIMSACSTQESSAVRAEIPPAVRTLLVNDTWWMTCVSLDSSTRTLCHSTAAC